MRGKFWYIDPKKLKFWIKMMSKYRIRLFQNLKFQISIFEKLGFGTMRHRDTKTKVSTFKEFGFPKSQKSAPRNLKFDFDFDFLGPKFN